MAEQFVGRGWAFPLRLDSRGAFLLVDDDREIEEAIRLILATAPGERPQRPDFGCGIHSAVFEQLDADTAGTVAWEVRRSLQRWEPRIDLDEVRVSFDTVDIGTLWIDVRYRIRGTNDPRNLVFPFYTIPDREPGD